jgi:hypothetical protein
MNADRHQERLARVALCRLTEPGDPRLTGLVSQLGAVRVHEHLADERDLEGMLTDVAGPAVAPPSTPSGTSTTHRVWESAS